MKIGKRLIRISDSHFILFDTLDSIFNVHGFGNEDPYDKLHIEMILNIHDKIWDSIYRHKYVYENR